MCIRKVFKALPAESVIVFANVTAVSIWGTKTIYDNIKRMNEENHFDVVEDNYMTPLDHLRERGHSFERGEKKTVL
ncbi:hypothetical protein DICPUDRAFT_160184 [Dictyostelium purpureum]|uniref:Uncharacterized protein n=1 Tax=Dictyostelium purpureum TaxID=5786 RepID=F1A5V5_DICPU|nr:uncharacterized protein DICPUDRAFT_160184 [Dictyostelium purpureum]EGC28422.1 hypothetical protein DICPUDRAFT_160184 [Dictyostelium purpureum]|eukprot:XP_003295049.1 hypothetical protein DICPUDRAFT_160184 [Dictyostelium purpureum]